MVYLLAIHAEEDVWLEHTQEEQDAQMALHDALQRDLEKADQWRGCGGLAPTSAATTLRRRDGKVVVTDGPYAEAKEQFGGYYLVEVDDLDQAIEIAKRIPTTPNGAVEIRPIAAFLR